MLGILIKSIWLVASLFAVAVVMLATLFLSPSVYVAGAETLDSERSLVIYADNAGTYYQRYANGASLQAIHPAPRRGDTISLADCRSCAPVDDLHAITPFCYAAGVDDPIYRYREPCPDLLSSGGWWRAVLSGVITFLLIFVVPVYVLRRRRKAAQRRNSSTTQA